MDMVEKVARAIFYKRADLEQWHWPTDLPRKWRSPGGALYDSNPIPNGTADRTRDQARAAIEAMREPTPEMMQSVSYWPGPWTYQGFLDNWVAAIDAALNSSAHNSGPQENDGGEDE